MQLTGSIETKGNPSQLAFTESIIGGSFNQDSYSPR